MAGFSVVHMRASRLQFFDCAGGEVEAGVAHDLLPEGDAGEFAFIVGVTVCPVEALEAGRGQAGDAQQGWHEHAGSGGPVKTIP